MNATTLKRVQAPFGYLGGKCRLAKRIVPRIPSHRTYVEPFCGAAWVCLSKPPSQVEVLNDLDGELINFWRVIQNHPEEFLRGCEFAVASRRMFDREKRQPAALLTDIQRAVRYYYLLRLCYGGVADQPTFSTSAAQPSRFHAGALRDEMTALHRRLRGVHIESLDACACIRCWDHPRTFFYVDPPYWGVRQYAHRFTLDDYVRLRDTLQQVKGKFLLSLNDRPEVRRLFRGFTVEPVTTRYFLSNVRLAPQSGKALGHELFIHNLNDP